MHKPSRQAIALLSLLFVTSAASAIVIRHDRDDARYRELGARYPVVGHLVGKVDCTLVTPRWVLGAAHTLARVGPFDDLYVQFGKDRYQVVKIILHPAWMRDVATTVGDMALLKLDRPVQGIAPALLYDKPDEVGKVILLVGHGQTGTGRTGPAGEVDHLVRGATNRIDRVDPTSIIFKFDPPPGGTDLEGLPGPGDSGGPALLEQGGKLYILGVSSNNDGLGGVCCRYGTSDYYTRVSSYRKWILDTIAADPRPTVDWSVPVKASAGRLPDTPAGKVAAELFRAYNAGDEQALARFYRERARPEVERKLMGDFATYGPYDLHSYSVAGPHRIRVLVFSKKASAWRSVDFSLAPGKVSKVERMLVKEQDPPKAKR
jgi:hypothetical protein